MDQLVKRRASLIRINWGKKLVGGGVFPCLEVDIFLCIITYNCQIKFVTHSHSTLSVLI